MELCYLVSTSTLNAILGPLATKETRYRLVSGQDMVTVVQYGPCGVINQIAFPIVFRIPDVPEEEGTLILMVATERSREWSHFWMPVEKHLPGTSLQPTA
jgi:hypothetical protein